MSSELFHPDFGVPDKLRPDFDRQITLSVWKSVPKWILYVFGCDKVCVLVVNFVVVSFHVCFQLRLMRD